jgi:putative restriction endonuclease
MSMPRVETAEGPVDHLVSFCSSLRRYTRGGIRAPNKPVTLLWALDRVAREEPRLTPFAVAEVELRPLLDTFGTPGTAASYAFWRLRSNGFWEVTQTGPLPARSGDKEPLITAMRRHAEGGFTESVHRRLKASPSLRETLERLLEGQLEGPSMYSPASKSNSWQTVRRLGRDRAFRSAVFRAYGSRCVVCGWGAKLNGRSLALDAAHIRAVSAGGSNDVDNGLPLCSFHHQLFDAGVFTWSAKRRLMIHPAWQDRDRGEMPSLLDHQGEVLLGPSMRRDRAAEVNLAWHRTHVFASRGRFRFSQHSSAAPS